MCTHVISAGSLVPGNVKLGINNSTCKIYILLLDNQNKTSFDGFESGKKQASNNNNSTDLL